MESLFESSASESTYKTKQITEWMNDLLFTLHQTECCRIGTTVIQVGDLDEMRRKKSKSVGHSMALSVAGRSEQFSPCEKKKEFVRAEPRARKAKSITSD